MHNNQVINKIYYYSFLKILKDWWIVFAFTIIGGWIFFSTGFKNIFSLPMLIMSLPGLIIILIPLSAILILLKTEILINENEITQKSFIKIKKILWEDIVLIEKKHFYALLPDFAKPVDIEITDKNKKRFKYIDF